MWQLGFGESRAIRAFQHAESELDYQRPFGASVPASAGDDGCHHRATINEVRQQGGPPEAREILSRLRHFTARLSHELARRRAADAGDHRAWSEGDATARCLHMAR